MNGLIMKKQWLLSAMLSLTVLTAGCERLSLPEQSQRKEATMGVSNGIVSVPINPREVYALLGVPKYNGWWDIGYICSNKHGKVNTGSRYKPVEDSTWQTPSESRFKELCYGFGDKVSSSDISQREWVYIPSSTKYRILDFENYNHFAPKFCSISLPSEIKGDRVNNAIIGYKRLTGDETTLGIKDIYPKEVKYWGVRVKFIKSGKILWCTFPLTANVFPIIPAMWYDLVAYETDGSNIQVTQFFSTGSGSSLFSYSTVSPESVGNTIYPVYAPSGEATTINVDSGGLVTRYYRPNDGNYYPSTHLYYAYASTQWWETVVKDEASVGMGRFMSLDAYMIAISSKVINGTREYLNVFEYRIPLDNPAYAVVTQGSAANIYNVKMALNLTFEKDTAVSYYIFFVNRNTTIGSQYVTLGVDYDLKYS